MLKLIEKSAPGVLEERERPAGYETCGQEM